MFTFLLMMILHIFEGKFLSLKEEGVESVDVADRFYYWLDHVGIKSELLHVELKSRASIALSLEC